MARLLGPDNNSRMAVLPSRLPAAGRTGTVYADAAGTVLADILAYQPANPTVPGATIGGSVVTTDDWGMLPQFWFPDGVDKVWATVNGGPLTVVNADYDARMDSTEAAAVVLPAPTGVDDTAAINTVLTASAGKRVRGRPGAAYLISAPLVVYSGTELDMTRCTITLKPASNCNMLNNAAVALVRRLLDAVTTATSTTLTSVTGAFTAADIGKRVEIQGAGAAGVPLVTTISAVTNGTTAVLAVAAGTSVTGQYAAIGARDSDITVLGGLWDRAANGPAGSTLGHSLRFRHLDGLTVRYVKFASTAGKYQLNPGDCTNVRLDHISGDSVGSDVVHVNGPARQVYIGHVIANSIHDDLVSLTAGDSTGLSAEGTPQTVRDVAGDITDVEVDVALFRTATYAASALKVIAGKTGDNSADYKVQRLRARSLTGPTTGAPVVFIGDGSGGRFDDIALDGVTSLGGSNTSVVLVQTGGTTGTLTVRNVVPAAGDKDIVAVGAAVSYLAVLDPQPQNRLTGYIARVSGATARVDSLIVENVTMTGATGQGVVRVETSGFVGSLRVHDVDYTAPAPADGSKLVQTATGTTLTQVEIDAVRTTNVDYPLGVFTGTTTVIPGTVQATGLHSWLYANTPSAAVTLLTSPLMLGDTDRVREDVAGSTAVILGSRLGHDPNLLTTGEETIPRLLVSGGQVAASGQLLLTYFTARRTETIANVRTMTEGTAAATPTLCRVGVYSVATNGDLTLVASIASDTTLWAASFGNYTRALTATWAKVVGRRYALGVLYVGTTAPKLRAIAPVNGSESGQAPRINGSVAGQTDLPASITSATVTNSAGISVYAAITP